MMLRILYAAAADGTCPRCGRKADRIMTRGYFARAGIVKEHVACARCGIRTLAYRPGEPPTIYGWIQTTKGKR